MFSLLVDELQVDKVVIRESEAETLSTCSRNLVSYIFLILKSTV